MQVKKKILYQLTDQESNVNTIRMMQFLLSKYEFVNNIILNEVYFRQKGHIGFEPVNPHTLYIQTRENGIRTTVSEINTFLSSDYIPKENPFESYFSGIKEIWSESTDGDYIDKFSSYIKVEEQERFSVQFKKWLVRCVACALQDEYFNKQAMIFVQDKQNSGKSTLTRFLVPEKLQGYKAENISTDKDSLIALTQNVLIIQDELATLAKSEINGQKTLMSKSSIKVRHPYDRKAKMEPRRASICGSTNRTEFLTDETGSVRWLCFIIQEINWSYKADIEIDKVWSQAYQLYLNGFKYEMTPEEISENEKSNTLHTNFSMEMELIQKYYSPGTKEQHDQFYTASDIVENLVTNTDGKVRVSSVEVGKALKMLGFEQNQKRNHDNNRFPVKGYYINYNDVTTYYK